ncbi:MAG: DUF2617 family protein [Planctomycetota bacterium]
MLTVRPRITDLNFHLFGQEVHPELFEVCAHRTVERDRYQLELNITPDGHVIRFRHDELVLTEVNAGAHHPLPTLAELLKQSIDGKLRNQLRYEDRIDYQTNVNLELVKPTLFVAVQQQLDQRVDTQGLVHRFGSNGRLSFGAISYMHVQSFMEHVLVRVFHTFPESGAVVTSESRFSVQD